MASPVENAVAALHQRIDSGFPHSVKFVIADHGTVMLKNGIAYEGSGPADCTLTAPVETFAAVLAGRQDPVVAYMSGDLLIEGDIRIAMALSAYL